MIQAYVSILQKNNEDGMKVSFFSYCKYMYTKNNKPQTIKTRAQ